jgi:hypothetical protein
MHGYLVIELVNPNSSHSFVNETHACQLDWVGKELPCIMHVSTPLGKTTVASKYLPDCGIQVGREKPKADLVMMAIEYYDLILGMD